MTKGCLQLGDAFPWLPATRRLNGVVVGTVIGSIAQRLFAVQLVPRHCLIWNPVRVTCMAR